MCNFNNKGFTLVELLATISILAIIMLMAIPNVVGIVQRNKNKTYIEDAKKVITLAKYEIKKDPSKKPSVGTSKKLYLNDLDKSKEIDDAPNGGQYERGVNSGSYVSVTNNNGTLNYKIILYEVKSSSKIGILDEVAEKYLYDSDSTSKVKIETYN